MPQEISVPQILTLPEPKAINWKQDRYGRQHVRAIKVSDSEIYPNSATPARSLLAPDIPRTYFTRD